MNTYEIIVLGDPIPKSRPRLSRYHTYDNQSEKKTTTKWILMSEVSKLNYKPVADYFELNVCFHMPIPKSTSQKKKNELLMHPKQMHVKKPDIDNLLKYYMDAGNGILWDDDAKISSIFSTKIYSENPRTQIIITQGFY